MFDWAWGPQVGKVSVDRKLAYFASMTALLMVLKASDPAPNIDLGSDIY